MENSHFIYPFIILWLGLLFVFYGRKEIGVVCAVVSVIGFFITSRIALSALLPLSLVSIATFMTIHYYHNQQTITARYIFRISFVVTILLSFAMATHVFGGFTNPIIAADLLVSNNAPSFTLYWNIDKAFVAFCLVLINMSITERPAVNNVYRNTVIYSTTVIIVTLLFAWGIGLVRLDPKLHAIFLWWFVANSFITCVAEEVFFRGIIQHQLEHSLQAFTKKYAWLIAILISGVLFGIAHHSQGLLYVSVAIVAGCGYGVVFWKTRRIEASIMAHLLLNTIHFTMFTYPMKLSI